MNYAKLFLLLCLPIATLDAYINYSYKAELDALRKQKRDFYGEIYNNHADSIFDKQFSSEMKNRCSEEVLAIMEQTAFETIDEVRSVLFALANECFLGQVYEKAYNIAEQEAYKYALSNKKELLGRIAREEKEEAVKRTRNNDAGSLRYIYTELKNRIANKIKSAAQAESAAAKSNAERAALNARNNR